MSNWIWVHKEPVHRMYYYSDTTFFFFFRFFVYTHTPPGLHSAAAMHSQHTLLSCFDAPTQVWRYFQHAT